MKIIKVISQHRRDMVVDLKCEHCGQVDRKNDAYDDEYCHAYVIPDLECSNCGKKAPSTYKPAATAYPEGMQI